MKFVPWKSIKKSIINPISRQMATLIFDFDVHNIINFLYLTYNYTKN